MKRIKEDLVYLYMKAAHPKELLDIPELKAIYDNHQEIMKLEHKRRQAQEEMAMMSHMDSELPSSKALRANHLLKHIFAHDREVVLEVRDPFDPRTEKGFFIASFDDPMMAQDFAESLKNMYRVRRTNDYLLEDMRNYFRGLRPDELENAMDNHAEWFYLASEGDVYQDWTDNIEVDEMF